MHFFFETIIDSLILYLKIGRVPFGAAPLQARLFGSVAKATVALPHLLGNSRKVHSETFRVRHMEGEAGSTEVRSTERLASLKYAGHSLQSSRVDTPK